MLEILFSLLTIYMCMHIVMLTYGNLTNKKLIVTLKKEMLLLILSILVFYLKKNNSNIITLISSLLSFCGPILIFDKTNPDEKFRTSIFMWIIGMILDILLSLLLILLGITAFNNYNIFIKSILSLILHVAYYYIVGIKIIKYRIIDILSFVEKNKFIFNMILVIAFNFFLLSILNTKFVSSFRIEIIILILSISFLIILIIIIYKNKKEHLLIRATNNLISINKIYDKELYTYKIIKHNIQNNLLCIKSVANKESKKLINQILIDNRFPKMNIDIDTNLPDSLKIIILSKLNNDNLKIQLNSDIATDPSKTLSTKSYIKMCEIIGILLDNAVYAALNSSKKIIYIEIAEDDDSYSFKVINSTNNYFDLTSIGKIHYSTKLKKSGLGIHHINSMLKTSEISYKIKNDLFIVHVIFKKYDP